MLGLWISENLLTIKPYILNVNIIFFLDLNKNNEDEFYYEILYYEIMKLKKKCIGEGKDLRRC